MVATRGRTFKRPWRRSCHSSKLKSSSAQIGRKDSWCFHAVGSSNAPLLGSTAAEGLQRIGRTSIATRWRSCGLPQSASCSENFVIPPDVFGQTLIYQHFLDAADRFSHVRITVMNVHHDQHREAHSGGGPRVGWGWTTPPTGWPSPPSTLSKPPWKICRILKTRGTGVVLCLALQTVVMWHANSCPNACNVFPELRI